MNHLFKFFLLFCGALVFAAHVPAYASQDAECAEFRATFHGIFQEFDGGSEDILHDHARQAGMQEALLDRFSDLSDADLARMEEKCGDASLGAETAPPPSGIIGGCTPERIRADFGRIADSEELNIYISSARNERDVLDRQKFQEDYIRANRLLEEGKHREACAILDQQKKILGLP